MNKVDYGRDIHNYYISLKNNYVIFHIHFNAGILNCLDLENEIENYIKETFFKEDDWVPIDQDNSVCRQLHIDIKVGVTSNSEFHYKIQLHGKSSVTCQEGIGLLQNKANDEI